MLIECSRRHYATRAPHSALGYGRPSSETILPHAAQELRADRRFKDGARSLNQHVVPNRKAFQFFSFSSFVSS